jgi:hypothetical protein
LQEIEMRPLTATVGLNSTPENLFCFGSLGVAQGGGAAGTDLPAPAQGPDGGTAGSPFVLNETWTPALSPSRVTSDAFVLELTFESNVTVKVCGNFVFEVAGQLQVEGASHAPIRFTPHDLTIG